jgi:hypothetical protein
MDISSKVFEILKEIVPGLHRIAVLATCAVWAQFARGQDQAAKALGIEYSYIDMPQPEAANAARRVRMSAWTCRSLDGKAAQ